MRDQNTRATLIEAVIAGGLIAVGIAAGQPLVALASSVAGVGGNWAHNLAERGFQCWRDRWFTDDGVLNHDIAKALCHAFVGTVRQVEHDWKQHRHYQYLQHKSPEQARLTLDTLRILREDGSDKLAQVTQQQQHDLVLSLLDQDESKANEYLKSVLTAFLYGHDYEFIMFIIEQLGPQWILRFLEILKDSDEEGTRAWRACQLLWQKSLMLGIGQIQQTTAETADTVRWLKEWAEQLKSRPPTQRDSTGQDALETILHSVHAQLDEMRKTLDETYAKVRDIKAIVEQIYQKVVPAPPTPPSIWNVPFARNPFFTGRGQLLEQLHKQLSHSKSAALTQPTALSGLGGIGKTQTAIEYAYRYRDEYRAVFWVRANSRETLVADYVAVARLLSLPEQKAQDQMQIVTAVKRWLEQQEGWLLILDNADELSLVTDFLSSIGKGHLLLTTRAQSTGKLAQSLSVEKMELSEGMQLVLCRAKLLDPEEPLDNISAPMRKATQQLISELDGLPLALDQAGAYIEDTGTSVSDYLELYHRYHVVLLQQQSSLSTNYPHTVASTWALSFTQVEQANPAAADLLRLCAFLYSDAIPEAIVTEGAMELGSVLSPVAADPLLLNGAIQVLRRYSMVKRDAEAKLLNMHRLVQVVLKTSLDQVAQRVWAERSVRAVNRAFPEAEFAFWERCELCLPHALLGAQWIEEYSFSFPEAARLLHVAGVYLRDRGQYAQAEPLLKQALTQREQVLGPEHSDTASTLNALASVYFFQGKVQQAKELLKPALVGFERMLGPEHPEVATALNRLANVYRYEGKYEQTEQLYERALTIREQAFGKNDIQVAESLNDLATLYDYQGQYAKAEPLMQRALALIENTQGPEHPDIPIALSNLAILYMHQGQYAQAEPLLQRALAIQERVLGPEHFDTGMSLRALGWLYALLGKYTQAEPLLQRAHALNERLLGPEHQVTVRDLFYLAQVSLATGQEARAESLYQQALAIQERVLGPEHPSVAETLTGLAQLYTRQGHYKQAESLLQRALPIAEHVVGSENPQTAAILDAQGHLALLQGWEEQAERLLQQALTIRKQETGTARSDVAHTLEHLAQLYEQQGKYEQAHSFYQQALAIQEQALGAEHPDTAETIHNLARCWKTQGNSDEACTCYARALSIREQALGAQHPETTKTRARLIELLHAIGRHENAAQLEAAQSGQRMNEVERMAHPEE